MLQSPDVADGEYQKREDNILRTRDKKLSPILRSLGNLDAFGFGPARLGLFFVSIGLISGLFFFPVLTEGPDSSMPKIGSNGEGDIGSFITFTIYISNNYSKKENIAESAKLPHFLPFVKLNYQPDNIAAQQIKNESSEKSSLTKLSVNIPDDAGLPKRLIIPSLGIDANIQYVGLTANGAMGVPDNASDVAWFKLGVRPGQPGNAVIAGHLDAVGGKRGVFWDLKKLKKSSEIYILDGNNNRLLFKVVEVKLYEDENASLESVFGYSATPRLNLITCDGVWDKEKNNYTKRLVVFAEKI